MTAGWKNQNKGRVTRTLKEASRRGQEMSWVFNFLLEEEQEPRRPLIQTSEVSASKLQAQMLAKVVVDDLYVLYVCFLYFYVRCFI